MISDSSSQAVATITGTADTARIIRSAWRPSRSGRPRSSTITSGGWWLSSRSPSSAVPALRTACSRFARSPMTADLTSGSSSMTSTRAMVEPYAFRYRLLQYWRCAAVNDETAWSAAAAGRAAAAESPGPAGTAGQRHRGVGRGHSHRRDPGLARCAGRAAGRGDRRAAGSGSQRRNAHVRACGPPVAKPQRFLLGVRQAVTRGRFAGPRARAVPPGPEPGFRGRAQLCADRWSRDVAGRSDIGATGRGEPGGRVLGADVVGGGLAARGLQRGLRRLLADRYLELWHPDRADLQRLTRTGPGAGPQLGPGADANRGPAHECTVRRARTRLLVHPWSLAPGCTRTWAGPGDRQSGYSGTMRTLSAVSSPVSGLSPPAACRAPSAGPAGRTAAA